MKKVRKDENHLKFERLRLQNWRYLMVGSSDIIVADVTGPSHLMPPIPHKGNMLGSALAKYSEYMDEVP